MHLLITNDDGLDSKGLDILIDWAKTIGDPVLIIPKNPCSGKSHAIDFIKPFEVQEVQPYRGVRTIIVDSTPADCVRIGICLYHLPVDMVLSGINLGINVGVDTLYSGTVAAVEEAAALGYPGVAFSAFPEALDEVRKDLDSVWNYISEYHLFDYSKHLNINFPISPKGIVLTRFGGPYIQDRFVSKGNQMYQADGYIAYEPAEGKGDDLHAVMNHWITVSPITIEKTDLAALEKMKSVTGQGKE